jgi:SAM-dependent methyltransferase
VLLKACPICFSGSVAETLVAKELSMGSGEVFEYCICSGCGSAYIANVPEDLSKYYDGYYSFGDAKAPIESSKLRQLAVKVYSLVVVKAGLSQLVRSAFRNPTPMQMRFLSPNLQAFLFLGAKQDARILDIGSGNGEFVRMMRRFGYINAYGIDPFLNDDLTYPHVRRSDILSERGVYDFLLFNHSLEHMLDPEKALRKSRELLSPGGKVVIQVPNMDASEFKRYKGHWCWMHAPFHIAIPSRRGLETMAARCGYKVIDTICTSRGDHYFYSEEYSRDISDRDPRSIRRKLEDGSLDRSTFAENARLAYALNKSLTGDWIAYYLAPS